MTVYVSATGKVFKATGTYQDTITNTAGCDSVITYNVTINTATTSTQSVTSTDSVISVLREKYLEASGTYLDTTYLIANGCDSILTYNVAISPPQLRQHKLVATCDSVISATGKVFKSSGHLF